MSAKKLHFNYMCLTVQFCFIVPFFPDGVHNKEICRLLAFDRRPYLCSINTRMEVPQSLISCWLEDVLAFGRRLYLYSIKFESGRSSKFNFMLVGDVWVFGRRLYLCSTNSRMDVLSPQERSDLNTISNR